MDPIEKLHTGVADIPELSGDESLPLLNSVEEVNKIVRSFLSDVIRNEFSGEMTKDQFMNWVIRRMKMLNYLFLGEYSDESNNYRRGVWNKPENLGAHILIHMGASSDCDTAVTFYLATTAKEAMDIMRDNELEGEDAANKALDQLCNRMVAMLLGVDEGAIQHQVTTHTTKDSPLIKPHTNKAAKNATLVPEEFHPKLNDKGQRVTILKPSTATDVSTWSDSDMVATLTPHHRKALPDELYGVKFTSWLDAPTTLPEWADVEGQNAEIAKTESELKSKPGMKKGAGVIVVEPDGRVWVVHPTNQFGGYKATFAKGTIENGLSLQASAIKEAYEELGLKVEITGFLTDVERTTSVARYYLARRVGGHPGDMGWESQAVSLVPVDQLNEVTDAPADKKLIEALKMLKL